MSLKSDVKNIRDGSRLDIEKLEAFIFDFDGVLTNNKVHLDQNGKEWVTCSRSDGLAFDVLKKINIPAYIISTEKNPVVTARAKKLKINVIQGTSDKVSSLNKLIKEKNYNLEQILYVGNDLNDFHVMQCCGYTACPSDSHPKIKNISKVILSNCGGDGVVRELLEDVLQLDFLTILNAP
jgi:3-deoxy-D-manno-octulosonate 8-phosphate phosphatase (KDO 8-P phosphatase)